MWTSNRRTRATGLTLARQTGIALAALACVGLSACTAAEAPSPASSTEAATVTPLPESGELDAGTYLVTGFTVPFEISVPDGWASGGWFLLREESDETAVAVNFQTPGYVPTDACAWNGAITEVDPSIDAFAAAMTAQISTETTPAVSIMVSGYPGLEFDHSVAADVDITDCDFGKICVHSDLENDCTRWHSSVNARETYRVVDLNGERFVMAVLGIGSVDPAMTEEARAVFDSIDFAPGP